MLRWSVATVLILGVMAASGYYVFMNALDAGQHVTVPSLVNKQLIDAVEDLAEAGLGYGAPVIRADESPAGTVIAQRPTAGRVVREGRKVTLTVSRGEGFRDAPTLVGKKRQDAVREIESLDLRPGSIARIPHAARRDDVIAQDPPPGYLLPHDGAVSLLVSAGDLSQRMLMPNIIGMTEEDAEKELGGLKDIVKERIVSKDETAKEGVVLDQSPPPNSDVFPGDTVTFTVREKKKEEKKEEEGEAFYTTSVSHTFSYPWHDHHVKIMVRDKNGTERPANPKEFPASTDPAAVRDRAANSHINITVPYQGEATVLIYDNGALVKSYRLKDGSPAQPL